MLFIDLLVPSSDAFGNQVVIPEVGAEVMPTRSC